MSLFNFLISHQNICSSFPNQGDKSKFNTLLSLRKTPILITHVLKHLPDGVYSKIFKVTILFYAFNFMGYWELKKQNGLSLKLLFLINPWTEHLLVRFFWLLIWDVNKQKQSFLIFAIKVIFKSWKCWNCADLSTTSKIKNSTIFVSCWNI